MSTGLKANSDGSAAIQVGGSDVITLTSGGAATFLTSPTTVQAGTAAAPSITFSGDTNTGIFSPAADTIAFTEGGVESMRITSSGNVGIGSTSITAIGTGVPTLELKGTSGSFTSRSGGISLVSQDGTTNKSYIYADTDLYIQNTTATNTRFYTNNQESMRITSAGEVLVGGTTSVDAKQGAISVESETAGNINLIRSDTSVVANDIFGSVSFWGNDTTSNTRTKHAYISAVASGTHAAGDNPTDLVFGCTPDGSSTVDEFARIQAFAVSRVFRLEQPTLSNDTNSEIQAAGGTAGTINRYASLYVRKHSGITNSCGSLYLSSEDAAINYIWADNSDVLRISTTVSNIGTTGGTVVGTQTSDERIKNIIGPVTYGLEQIKSINPVEYTLKDDVEQTKRIGFIAQQVQPIVPESVYDTKEVIVEGEPTKLGMEYVSLIPVLVKAMQEQQVMIDELKAKVAALENA